MTRLSGAIENENTANRHAVCSIFVFQVCFSYFSNEALGNRHAASACGMTVTESLIFSQFKYIMLLGKQW